MIIKRTINFYPNKSKLKGDGNAPLRCYVRWNNISLTINLGYNINITAWNSDTQRVKKNSYHDTQNIPATEINKIIASCEELINKCFEHYEASELIPNKEELKELIDIKTGKKKADTNDNISFFLVIDKYIEYGLRTLNWTYNAVKHIRSLKNQLLDFDKNCNIADFDNQNMPERLISYFLSIKGGNNNYTMYRKFKYIKAILRYAISLKIIDNSNFLSWKFQAKMPKRPVIFLTWEELMRVYNYDFSATPHLDSVRDVFCFCCFTSLRYSDVANLKKSNISDHCIHLTTIKTGEALTIELNKYSQAILDKHSNHYSQNGCVLPIISNQKMNDHLKEIAVLCEINTPISITTYKGGKRIDYTVPKHTLISTHVGRRTFISNAIMLGIPPEIVMKWSGHSDYNSMKPYIEIANEAKKQAMSIFDKL